MSCFTHSLRQYSGLLSVLILTAVQCPLLAAAPAIKVETQSKIVEENILSTINLSNYDCDISEWRLDRIKRLVESDARLAMQAVGYYQGEITTLFDNKDNCWQLILNVTAGPRTIFKNSEIQIIGNMNQLASVKSMLKTDGIEDGSPLRHDIYQHLKTEIQVLAARFGYFDGIFTTSELLIDPQTNTAAARLIFSSGERARFGNVTIDQDFLNAKVFQDFILIKEGQAYDNRILIDQQQTLSATGYFGAVEIEPATRNPDKLTVPIHIKLTAGKRFAYRFGIGASTDIGPRVSFDYTDRRINKRGHHFNASGRFTRIRSEAAATYSIPRGKAGANRLDFQLGYLWEDTDDASNSSYKFAAREHVLLSSGWLKTWFVEYLHEDYTTPQEKTSSQFLLPGLSFNKKEADNEIRPRNGWRLKSEIRVAYENIASTTNLVKLDLSGKIIKPLGPGRLLARLDLGWSDPGEFSELPVSLRYYAGGDSSVRGFDYRALGPVNEQGEVLGGPYLATASVEYEHPLFNQWGIAFFVDSGNAFDTIAADDLKTGAGLGVRWHSPIGPIRLDIASDIDGENDPRVHLSMGLDL